IGLAATHLAHRIEASVEAVREQNRERLGVEAMRLAHRDGFRQRLDRGSRNLAGLTRHYDSWRFRLAVDRFLRSSGFALPARWSASGPSASRSARVRAHA